MALTDDSSSFERDLPPPPIPTSRQASNQSLHTLSDAPDRSTDYRSSFSRDRSSRESRRSVHNEIELRFQQIHSRLQAEKRRAEVAERRAEDAERKLREMTGHLKAINDARLETLRDAGRANEELKLYRVQLDNAQQEIYRAQDIIGVVDRQRYNAEQDAEKQRRKARQLQETVLIQKAREEAFQQGLQEGLARGRELTFGELRYHGGEEAREPIHRERVDDDYSPQGSRSSSPENNLPNHTYPSRARSIAPSDHSRAPTRNHASPLPAHPPLPINPPAQPLPHPVGPSTAPPSIHPSEKSRPPSVRNVGLPVHPPETVRPVSIRQGGAPSINESIRPTSIWNTPSLHGSENIQPIPIRNISHTPRMSNAIIPPDNLIPSMDADNRIRIPPPFEFQSDFQKTPERPVSELPIMSEASIEPVPIPPRTTQQRKHNAHSRNSSSGSNSSSLSQLDIINFNPALRTPMSVIPEVNSTYSGSPQPRSEVGDPGAHSIRHQPSFGGNSYKHFQASPIVMPGLDNENQFRPRSRSSFAPSMAEPPTQSRRDSRISSTSTIPNINVQAPSNTASIKTDSQRGGGSGRGETPSSQHAPLPSVFESKEQRLDSSGYNYGGMPGSYVNTHSSAVAVTDPPIIPKNIDFNDEYRDDDAVSSALSADSLTTPPGYHRKL